MLPLCPQYILFVFYHVSLVEHGEYFNDSGGYYCNKATIAYSIQRKTQLLFTLIVATFPQYISMITKLTKLCSLLIMNKLCSTERI